jgi:hypothetical protein
MLTDNTDPDREIKVNIKKSGFSSRQKNKKWERAFTVVVGNASIGGKNGINSVR